MRLIRLMLAFSCLQASTTFALSIEGQVQNYINNVEIPRLSGIYPDAAVKITLNNKISLSYLPTCKDKHIQIKNQRPSASKRTTYSISCNNPMWKSYLPVTQSILIPAFKTLAPINRGQAFTKQNIGIGNVDLTNLRGQVYTPQNPPYGLVASRNLRINTFISDNVTQKPTLIKKGNQILITAKSGNITVKMNGIALQNGVEGQQIRVKNTSSGRIIYAKVVTDSEVLVNY
ncbi:flagellar basal body P-ring biosynthesis protein FlgA [Marinomonas spartinae]|uniref:Flagella basal body P-ring formation protein FlgA n=1 Tax=Marinomonas spartinae TaxID=1792290 RepID=A0A1A8T6G7_9GAMM|nr:flagellar basal body P-ring formation chaperone FlgA [Marinomonas spartinae]SBS28049.1 flagellar basal body P-ring biosynthesis protein FlgA [Marinomonas spartinae]SBS28632.1 flagellar basal body P-ring biosynthesis protein FlgA [Marinomonas spartinae]